MPLRRPGSGFFLLLWLGAIILGPVSSWGSEPTLVVVPDRVVLGGNFARAQLLVAQPAVDARVSDRSDDLTLLATYRCSDASVVHVNAVGQLIATGNGEATIEIEHDGHKATVPVTVSGFSDQPRIEFLREIRPLLSKAGCAMAACHAAQHGKGGFKLSVFGFEPDKDRDAMVRDSLARRADFVEPQRSLLLLKPTMQTPHGGAKRLEKGSTEYQIMLAWLACGAPGPQKNDASVSRISITPPQRVGQPGLTQQLRVVAEYSDGTSRDVTASARYDSLDDGVVSVTASGLVTAIGQGQGAVMVRYEEQAAVSHFMIPYGNDLQLAGWSNQNFIDELAAAKFRELGIEPSPLCNDATFIRRAFLDAIGTLPMAEETRAFLESDNPQKRTELIDRLLGLAPGEAKYSDAYAAWWSLKWSDLLRNN
jgi:hypothetical protein